MTLVRRRAPGAGIALMVLATLATPSALLAQDSIPTLMERTGTFRSKRVPESSGVAVSRRYPGVLWTHNDSGDKPFVYAVDASGELLVAFEVTAARAEDWEDIALARCPNRDGSCLYIADTGDNSERRRSVSLYIVSEPDPGGSRVANDTRRTAPARELRLTYPDGPHDVEALFVDRSGNASLITKGRTGVVVRFVVPHAAFDHDTATAVLADTLPIVPQRTLGRLVTGAAISPSDRRVVVRTYSELYFFKHTVGGRLSPDGKPCWLGAAEPQGEGVDFLDEDTVVLTSESLPSQDGTVYRVRCSRRSSGR